MQTYSKFQPTGFDPAGLGLPDQQDWLVPEVAINRDSETLSVSNWNCFLTELRKIDAEGNDWQIVRFGHWANGWFEIIIVRPDTAVEKLAEELCDALSDYPILNESDYSAREVEAVTEWWVGMRLKDRVDYIQQYNKQHPNWRDGEVVSIFAARRDELPNDLYSYLRDRYEG